MRKISSPGKKNTLLLALLSLLMIGSIEAMKNGQNSYVKKFICEYPQRRTK